jgi:hypothetical protein
MPAEKLQALVPAGFNVFYVLFGNASVPIGDGPYTSAKSENETPVTSKDDVGVKEPLPDTTAYPSNRGAKAAAGKPDLAILRNCIEVLEERESYRRLGPPEKARAVVALYELYQLSGESPREILQRNVG